MSLTGVSVLTSGANAPGIQATGGDGMTGGQSSVTTAVLTGETPTPTTVTTTGDNSPGVQADSGGQVTLNGGSVTTSGTGSTGLYATGADGVTGAASTIAATNVAISTSVNPGPGTNAVGVLASAGGMATLSGGSVMTSGDFAHGLYATGAGSSIMASNGTTISTSGAGANGVQADTGGHVTLGGGSVVTTGPGSVGLFATGNGSQNSATDVAVPGATGTFGHALFFYQGGQITMTGGSANTAGTTDYVVGVLGGGRVDLNGTMISATAAGSGGLFINGAGGVINATDVTIATQGGVDSSTGASGGGAYNGSYPGYPQGGTMVLTNTTIDTVGLSANGVDTNGDGSTTLTNSSVTLTNSSVTTSGQDAHALIVSGTGSQSILNGSNTFSNQGAGAMGLYATAGGGITATGPVTITTTGGVSPSTGLARLWRQRGRRGVTDQARLGDYHDLGRRGLRPLCQRRHLERDRRLDHGNRPLTIKTTNAAAAAVGLAGQRGVDPGDRRRDDRLSGQHDLHDRRDQPDRDLRPFHDQQHDRQSDLRRSVGLDRQFQQHHRQRGKQQFARCDRRQQRHSQRERLDIDGRDFRRTPPRA